MRNTPAGKFLLALVVIGLLQHVAAILYTGATVWPERDLGATAFEIGFTSSAFLIPLVLMAMMQTPTRLERAILFLMVLGMMGYSSWIYYDHIVATVDRKGFYFIAVRIVQWEIALGGALAVGSTQLGKWLLSLRTANAQQVTGNSQ